MDQFETDNSDILRQIGGHGGNIFFPLKLVQLLVDYECEHSALRKRFVGCVYRFCEFVRAGHLFHSYNSRYPIGTSTGITLL